MDNKLQHIKKINNIEKEARIKKLKVFESLHDSFFYDTKVRIDGFKSNEIRIGLSLNYILKQPITSNEMLKVFFANFNFKGKIENGVILNMSLTAESNNILETTSSVLYELLENSNELIKLDNSRDFKGMFDFVINEHLFKIKDEKSFILEHELKGGSGPYIMEKYKKGLSISKNLKEKVFVLNTYKQYNSEEFDEFSEKHEDVLNKNIAAQYLNKNLNIKPNNLNKMKI